MNEISHVINSYIETIKSNTAEDKLTWQRDVNELNSTVHTFAPTAASFGVYKNILEHVASLFVGTLIFDTLDESILKQYDIILDINAVLFKKQIDHCQNCFSYSHSRRDKKLQVKLLSIRQTLLWFFSTFLHLFLK